MKSVVILLSMLLLATLALPAFGADFATLTSAELKAMIDRNEPGLVIIDSRAQSQFDQAHIKGAISIPLAEMEQNAALSKAPKDAKLLFYCSGST